jgi:hypothetical protein
MVDQHKGAQNVVWDSQSTCAGDSMPVGGGDIGLNVWVEEDELFVYLARAGCRDENGALLKLGRIRIRLSPNPFEKGEFFRQELSLDRSCVEITTGEATIRVWAEVHRPVVHLDIETDDPSDISATYESWRFEDILLPDDGVKNRRRGMCMINYDAFPGDVWLYKDVIESGKDSVLAYHRVRDDKSVFDFQIRQQDLEPIRDRLHDPLKGLTFGGVMTGNGLVFDGSTEGEYGFTPYRGFRYVSKKKCCSHSVRFYSHIEQTKNAAVWKDGLNLLLAQEHPTDREAWQRNQGWWRGFWGRSFITIHDSDPSGDRSVPWQLGRNYALMRYMLACNLSGREPTMFNGGLFTFDPVCADERFRGPGYTPDHRAWGGALTAQNQRMLYWPLLKTGDFDLMIPGFGFYLDGLVNARERVRHYWNHDGCCFEEQTAVTALPGPCQYGFFEGGTRGRASDFESGIQINNAGGRVYESQLEWSWMIVQYQRFSGCDISEYLPLIEQSVIFYDEHYRYRCANLTGDELGSDGKLVIYPANTLENHPDCRNPASVIAGLRQVLLALIRLSPEREDRWSEMLGRLPSLPVGEIDGRRIMKPAENYSANNWVMPEMYPLYPYQIYGIGLPDLDLMRDTFLHAVPKQYREHHAAWTQGLIHYARLGMTDDAQRHIILKLKNGPHRFPAFWPQDIDWVPDHNWGGCGMIGLQEMLMQTHDGKIRLLPTWPREWDVDFKLHAPGGTAVECSVRSGEVVRLVITPEERMADVVVSSV